MSLFKEQTLAHKLITKGSLAYIFAFLIAPTGYAVRVIASNTLSVGEVGVFYSILGLITILAAYNDLGLTEALQYFLPKYRIEKKYNHYKTIRILTFLMQLVSGILIGGGLWLGAERLADNYFQSPTTIGVIKVFSVYFVAINFLQSLASVYTAFQDVLYDKIVETVRMYSVLIFTLVFWLTQSISIRTISYAWLGGLAIGLALSLFLFGIKYAKTLRKGVFVRDNKLIKKQLGYAFWVFLGINAGTLLGQVDQQMIITILGPESAGYYTNYLSLFSLYSIFAYPFIGLLFPIVTELITKNQVDKITTLLSILYKYFSVFGFMIGGFLIVLGPTISGVLYGSHFIYSGILLSYAAGFVVFNILLAINFSLMAGMGKVKQRVQILGTALLINIMGNLLFMLVLDWGIVGAICATIISWVLMFLLTFILIWKYYPFGFDWLFLIKNIFFIIILSIGLRWAAGYIDRSIANMRSLRVAYLALLASVYSCLLALINYRSIVLLWQEIKRLVFVQS